MMYNEYNVNRIIKTGNEIRKHRGKDIMHIQYLIYFNDQTKLNIFVPHYFEKIGFKRKIIKSLKKDKINKRNKKINKLKWKIYHI